MSYQDRTLTCQDCGRDFTFSADDQSYFASRGYIHDPKRCMACRASRRGTSSSGSSVGYDRPQREMHPAVCAECGTETTVPFRPRGDRPVYCRTCFDRQRAASGRY